MHVSTAPVGVGDARQHQVSAQASILRDKLDRLQSLQTELCGRLGHVSQCSAPSTKGEVRAQPQEVLCEFAQQLASMAVTADAMGDMLQDQIRRLEI